MIRIAAVAFTLLTLAFGPALAADPPLARMQEVIRSYGDAKQFMGTVLIEKDGKLVTQATKQPKIAIFAQDQTNFFARQIDAQITFVTEGDALASAIVLHQGGHDTTAKRIP